MLRRALPWLALVGVAALTAAVRVPGLMSDRHIDFDEGVYGVSVLAMRDGYQPFRDIFSSQGPLFLPILEIFDTIGMQHFRAVRLGMILTALVFTMGVYVVARHATDHGSLLPPLAAAAAVGTATAGIAAAGPIHSDGLALAFGVWAVAVLLGAGRFGRWRPVAAGLLLGAGVAVKSLFVLPMALAVAWHYAARRQWASVATAAGTAAGLALASAVPWGIANVWDQFIVFQLAAPRERLPLTNVSNIVTLVSSRDPIFVLLAGVGTATVIARIVARRRPVLPDSSSSTVLVWLLAAVLLLVFGTELNRGFYRFLIVAITPAMVLFAIVRPPRASIAAAAVVAIALIPVQLEGGQTFLTRHHPTPAEHALIARLDALPAGALVISDEPGLAWLANRYPPPDLVDTSFARIRAGYLTLDEVALGAARDDACAVAAVSGRFAELSGTLMAGIDGYSVVLDSGSGRRLYVKDGCAPP